MRRGACSGGSGDGSQRSRVGRRLRPALVLVWSPAFRGGRGLVPAALLLASAAAQHATRQWRRRRCSCLLDPLYLHGFDHRALLPLLSHHGADPHLSFSCLCPHPPPSPPPSLLLSSLLVCSVFVVLWALLALDWLLAPAHPFVFSWGLSWARSWPCLAFIPPRCMPPCGRCWCWVRGGCALSRRGSRGGRPGWFGSRPTRPPASSPGLVPSLRPGSVRFPGRPSGYAPLRLVASFRP